MSQLRDDLYNRIRERHIQWNKDSAALYQMAGLKPRHLQQDVFVVLMIEVVGFCYRFDLRPEEIAESISMAIKHFDEMEAKQ